MPGLSTLPVYPVPGRQAAVSFALTESGSNYVRVWCTNAPPDSELRTQIDGTADPRNRVLFYEGDGGSGSPKRFTFDKGGRYTLVAQEYVKNASAFGGGYQGDPDGAPSETKVGSEATLSLFIGQRMTSELRAGADALTVVLWVWDGTIQRTTVETHGEATPAVQATAPTVRTQAAMESSTVQTQLASLAGVAVATAVGTPATILTALIAKYQAHRTQATVHQSNDVDNVVPAGLSSAASATNLADTVNEFLRFIRQHYTNDAVEGGTVSGRDSGGYHDVGGLKNDNLNMPLVQSASDPESAYWATADIRRSLAAHFISTAVHDAADNTNTPATTTPLHALGESIFLVWASTTPTTPATQSDGAMTLIAKAGFSETPLES